MQQHALATFCCMMYIVAQSQAIPDSPILWLDASSRESGWIATASFAATGRDHESAGDACPGGSHKACSEMCTTSAHTQLHKPCVANCQKNCPGAASDSGNAGLVLYTQQVGEANSTRTKLSYQQTASGYVSALPVTSPFLLEASAALVKDRTLIQFWANADRAQRPNDWFNIQDVAQSALEVTLRDPYMKQSNHSGPDRFSRAAADNVDSEDPDQCDRGERWNAGDACFIAVVRFNQSLFGLDVNLTTYSEGKELRTAFIPASSMGVAIIRVPISADNTTYASVSYKEQKSGTHAGQPFDHILHWATTSTILNR